MTTPDERTMLTTLTEPQANLVGQAYMRLQAAKKQYDEAVREFNEKLAMVAPPGANGFDVQTMTFYSEPPAPPEVTEE